VFNVGPTELIVILIVALVVFGPKRLPEIGRTLGRSLQEFRRASNDLRQELERGITDEPVTGTSTSPSTSPSTQPDDQGPASGAGRADDAGATGANPTA
jgi:sec-independent protein translocase protein TatA